MMNDGGKGLRKACHGFAFIIRYATFDIAITPDWLLSLET